jgi:hypothetical protein
VKVPRGGLHTCPATINSEGGAAPSAQRANVPKLAGPNYARNLPQATDVMRGGTSDHSSCRRWPASGCRRMGSSGLQ